MRKPILCILSAAFIASMLLIPAKHFNAFGDTNEGPAASSDAVSEEIAETVSDSEPQEESTVVVPLTRDVPYLFYSERTLLLPDKELDFNMFSEAVTSIYPEVSAIGIPGSEEDFGIPHILQFLSSCYPEDQIPQLPEDRMLTRGEFAHLMNQLTGRSLTDIVPDEAGRITVDLLPDHPYYADLLEASVPHTHTEDGKAWEETELEIQWHEFERYEDMQYHEPTQIGTVEETWGSKNERYLIYAPYDYDPAQKYNVLLLLGGGDGDPDQVLSDKGYFRYNNRILNSPMTTKQYLEFLMEYGYCDPLIIVSAYTTMGTLRVERYTELLRYVIDHYSTYAESSEIEDIVAARKHFAISGCSNGSQSICVTIQVLPDMFAYYGMGSGMYQFDMTMDALRQKAPIEYMVLNTGENDSGRWSTERAYAAMSEMDNIKELNFLMIQRWGHDQMVFDSGIRELLFRFCPNTRDLPLN